MCVCVCVCVLILRVENAERKKTVFGTQQEIQIEISGQSLFINRAVHKQRRPGGSRLLKLSKQ